MCCTAVSENPIQILCGHYHYLIESMDPNKIAGIPFFKSLLSVNELDVFLHSPIDYTRSTYILECIRSLETPEIFLFIDALQEVGTQKHICDTLLNGKHLS